MLFNTIPRSQNWVRRRKSTMLSEINSLLLRFLLLNLNRLAIWFGFGFLSSPIKRLISAYELLPISLVAAKFLNNLLVSELQELSNAAFFLVVVFNTVCQKKNPPFALCSYVVALRWR